MQARSKGYAVLAGVFLLGAIAGGGASYAFAQRRHAAAAHEPRAEQELRRLRALARELDLSGEQRDRIRAIAEQQRSERREAARAALEKCGVPAEEQRRKLESEIRAVLTPAQQARYDALLERRRERGGRRRGD